MKRLLYVALIALLLSENFVSGFVARAQTSPATTDPTQAQESGFAVDITQDCKGLEEDQPIPEPPSSFPTEFVIDVPWEWPPLISIPFPTWTYPLGHIDWKINSFSDWLNTLGFTAQSNPTPAEVKIKTGIFSVNEGDEIALNGQANNFRTALDKLAYGWWTVSKEGDKDVLYSLNGVVAGGEAFTAADKPIGDTTRCGIATRKAKKDTDGDGMDDDWERRYAPHGDIKAFLPSDDKDQDGYVASSFQQNDTGDSLSVAPNSRIGNTSFVTGDGEFTNLEEYVWGTNPLDADTDDDGYADEADVSGIGQSQLKYSPKDFNGMSQTVELDVLGETRLNGENDNLVTQILGYRVNVPVLLQQDLSALVIPSKLNPQLGEKFQVQVIPGGTSTNTGNFNYQWNVTSNEQAIAINSVGAPCVLLGFNNALECTFGPGSIATGQRVTFKASIIDPKLGNHAEGSADVTIGNSTLVTSNPTLVPQYPVDQTGQHPVAPEGNVELGERWVELTATLTEGSSDNFYYDWYVDDEKRTDTCSKTPLAFTGRAEPQGIVICGVGTNILYLHATQNNVHTYNVHVKISNKVDGDVVADEYMKLFTDPTPQAYPGQAIASGQNLLQVAKSEVKPYENIVVAESNIETSDSHTYEYVWSVDGQVVSQGSQRVLEINAQPNKAKYDIELQVIEKMGNAVLSKKIATTTVAVDTASKFEQWRDDRLATVQTAFYPLYHTMAGNTSLFLVGAGLVIIVSVFILDKKKVRLG